MEFILILAISLIAAASVVGIMYYYRDKLNTYKKQIIAILVAFGIISAPFMLMEGPESGEFGYNASGDGWTVINNRQVATWGLVSDGDGEVDCIYAYMHGYAGGSSQFDVKGALYTYNGDADPVDKIAETEEKTNLIIGDSVNRWVRLNFSSPPSVTNNTKYFIALMGNLDSGAGIGLMAQSGDSGYSVYCTQTYEDGFEDPWEDDTGSSYHRCLYALYTPSEAGWVNSNPVNLNPDPQNGNTSVDVQTKLRIVVNDLDDANQSMNITWSSNSSGTWQVFGINNSVSNGTYYQNNINFTGYGKKYYWNVSTNDGAGGWDNDSYSFTTRNILIEKWKFKIRDYAPNTYWGVNNTFTSRVIPIGANVIGNENMELFFSSGYYDSDTAKKWGIIVCVNGSDGTEIWNYSNVGIGCHACVELGDCDNDDDLEAIICGYYEVRCVHAENGTLLWNYTSTSRMDRPPIIYEIDGEDYVYHSINNFYDLSIPYLRKVYGSNGTEVVNVSTGQTPCNGGLAAADVNNDGKLEIISTSRDDPEGDGLQCYDENLNLLWSYDNVSCSGGTPAIVDFDNDGYLDILAFETSAGSAWIGVVDGETGNIMPGKWNSSENMTLYVHDTPTINDIDEDGDIEIYTQREGNDKIQVWDATNWKWETNLTEANNTKSLQNPVMANVLGDSSLEIIHSSSGSVYADRGLRFWNKTNNFIKQEVTAVFNYFIVDDCDNDNMNELFGFSTYNGVGGWVVAYDTDGETLGADIENMYYSKLRNSVEEFFSGNPPAIRNPNPDNLSIAIELTPILNVTVDDVDTNTLNVTWHSNSSGTWELFGINNSIDVSSGSVNIVQNNSNFSAYITKYYWSVNATDGIYWTNRTYSFTTKLTPYSNSPPVITPHYKFTNNSIDKRIDAVIKVNISDPNGNLTTVKWYRYWDGTYHHVQTNVSVGNETVSYDRVSVYWYHNDINWYVDVTDEYDNVSNYWQRFWTMYNVEPYVHDFTVNGTGNNSVDVIRWPRLEIEVNDNTSHMGDDFTVYWSTNGTGIYQANVSVYNGTYVDLNCSFADSYSTKYYVQIYANDTCNPQDEEGNTSRWYTFTTKAEPSGPPYVDLPPTISNPQPANNSWDVNRINHVAIDVADPNGNDSLSVKWYRWFSGWSLVQENTSFGSNGTCRWNHGDFGYGQEVRWYAEVSDGSGGSANTTNEWMIFHAENESAPPQYYSNIYYVGTNGSDSTGTGSKNNPWRHIDYAWESGTGPCIINIYAGTYDEKVYKDSSNDAIMSGNTTHPTIIRPFENDYVVWKEGNDSSDSGCLKTMRVHDLIVCGIHFKDGAYHGVFFGNSVSTYYAHNLSVIDCTFDNMSCSAIKFNGYSNRIRDVAVERCITDEINNCWSGVNSQEGISFSKTDWGRVNDTIMSNGHKNNIDVKSGSSHIEIYDCMINTSHGWTPVLVNPWNSGGGIYFDAYGSSSSWNSAHNNFIWGNFSCIHMGSELDDGSNAGCNNNTAYNNILIVNQSPHYAHFPAYLQGTQNPSSMEAQTRYCSFYGNTLIGGESSFGVYNDWEDIIGCNFSDNICEGPDTFSIRLQDGNSYPGLAVYNNLFNKTSEKYGEHPVNGSPLLKGSGSDPYNLSATSPAIDAGGDFGIYEDYAYTTRPINGVFDIGAYERLYVAGWVNTPPTQSDFRANGHTNNSGGVPRWPRLNITTADADGNATNIYWSTNGSANYQVNLSSANGTYRDLNFSFASSWNTKYYVTISVNDTHENVTRLYTFTTKPKPYVNLPPTQTDFKANGHANNSGGVPRWPRLNITTADPNGNTTNIYWSTNGSANYQSNLSVVNGTYRDLNFSFASSWDTKYYVEIAVNDGWENISRLYTFTTKPKPYVNSPPVQSDFKVNGTGNESTNVIRWPRINITTSDPNGNATNIYWSTNGSANYQSNLSSVNGTYRDLNFSFASAYDTKYYVAIAVNDGWENISKWYCFTTRLKPNPNDEPVQSDFKVNGTGNESTNVIRWPKINITISDADGHNMNVYWSTNGSANYQTNSSVGNGTYRDINFSFASSYSTKYYVRINVSDGIVTTPRWYCFTTKAAPSPPAGNPPAFSNEFPDNRSKGVSLKHTAFTIDINDAEGDSFDWTIQSRGFSSSANGASNGTKSLTMNLHPNTNYTVYVNATDGVYTRETFWFCTTFNSSISVDGLNNGYVTFKGWSTAGYNQVWCNSTGASDDTLRCTITSNETYKITRMNITIHDMNDTGADIPSENIHVYASIDNITYYNFSNNAGDGTDVMIDASTWLAGDDPFEITTNTTIYVRFKLIIPTGLAQDMYYGVGGDRWSITITRMPK